MRPYPTSDVLILGAGPAGIGVAHAMGKDGLLIEKSLDFGGLCTTVEFAGAVFDLGGHSFHTPHPQVHKIVFDALEMYEQERDARCYHNKEWLPYPFQQNFGRLSCSKTVDECTQGLIELSASPDYSNFRDFIHARFGSGVAKHFMIPYNEKLWGDELAQMDAAWVGERIAGSNKNNNNQHFKVSGGIRTPLQSGTRVAYPARGGFGEIFCALGAQLPSKRFGSEIVQIDPHRRIATDQNGSKYGYRFLVSTLPLPYLLGTIIGIPNEITSAVALLEAVGLELLLIAVDEPVGTEIQRIYSAQKDVPAHKIAINHNSSDWLRAKPAHGIIAEISHAQIYRYGNRDIAKILVDNLIEMGILKSADLVREARRIRIDNAYPVPTNNRPRAVQLAKTWLEEHGIFSIGRFGEWAYINADESLYRGLRLGESLCK